MHPGKTLDISKENYQLKIYVDPQNRRLRVDDYLGDLAAVLEFSEEMAGREKADKLIIKARREHFAPLLEKGYRFEAAIDGYFLGSDCLFFSKFLSEERQKSLHWIEEDGILKSVYHLADPKKTILPPNTYFLKKMEPSDSVRLSELYRTVFQVYPTPLNHPDYILQTMKEGTVYYGFTHGEKVVSAASAELNTFYRNAELTDCATLKEHRKHGLMKILLNRLEQELIENGIFCSYSIARALSFGMNAVLHQLGYAYRGRLVNNVYIYDKIENMNVWVKDLAKPPNFRQ